MGREDPDTPAAVGTAVVVTEVDVVGPVEERRSALEEERLCRRVRGTGGTVGTTLGRSGHHGGRLVGDGQSVEAEAARALLVDEVHSVTISDDDVPAAVDGKAVARRGHIAHVDRGGRRTRQTDVCDGVQVTGGHRDPVESSGGLGHDLNGGGSCEFAGDQEIAVLVEGHRRRLDGIRDGYRRHRVAELVVARLGDQTCGAGSRHDVHVPRGEGSVLDRSVVGLDVVLVRLGGSGDQVHEDRARLRRSDGRVTVGGIEGHVGRIDLGRALGHRNAQGGSRGA